MHESDIFCVNDKKVNMKSLIVLLISSVFVLSGFSQEIPVKGTHGGMVSVGQRTTFSTFNANGDERSALGIGGQFRVRLSDRINTEWFFDYLPATNTYTRREDYHIGWSVLYYLREAPRPKWQPYVLAGHCFDYTHHVDLTDRTNQIQRWSSAIQAGVGNHFNLTPRLDMSIMAQYMLHLGTHIHSHIHDDEVSFHTEKGGIMEGHLLFTVGFNYAITDLWGGK
jgi:hypothetical protein